MSNGPTRQRQSIVALVGLALALSGCGAGSDAVTKGPSTRTAAQIRATHDTVVLPGPRSSYAVTPTPDGVTVTDTAGSGITRVLANGVRLRFADISLAFDFSANAGQAYRLYQAAFNRVPDPAGLGFWMKAMDGGASVSDVAGAFVTSAEYANVYGSAGRAADVIAAYYANALHRVGDPAGIAYWIEKLDDQGVTRAQLLVAFSESAENQAGVLPAVVDGIAYREDGVAYTPWANAGPSQDITVPARVTLDGGASLAASPGSALAYRWTLSAKPEGSTALLVLATTARPVFQADLPGVYEATLVVSDGVRDGAAAKVNIVALWKPAAGTIPAMGNAVYLESQQGDFIGLGGNFLYTRADAGLSVAGDGAGVSVRVKGDQEWIGYFAAPRATARLQTGYFHRASQGVVNPAAGMLSWSGEGRACAESGWFYIDKVRYAGDALAAIDLRFEQHCDGSAPALRGQIHWSVNEIATAPGPVLPVPATLWAPAATLLPASGSYVYLDSASGDDIGRSQIYSYAGPVAPLSISASGAFLSVKVDGWEGAFEGMNSLNLLAPGYYGGLTQLPSSNKVKGGILWRGHDRACHAASGWFAVDSLSYTGAALTAIDLRFEQHCNGSASALRGKIHWTAP